MVANKTGSGIQSRSSRQSECLLLTGRFAYERIRQSICLVRAMRRFQAEHGWENWPAVLAGGDFTAQIGGFS